MKRDYIGGEPTYKQVERLQKIQENEMEKWRAQEMTISQAVPVVQPTYIDPPKTEFINHALYFSDVTGMLQQQQPQMSKYLSNIVHTASCEWSFERESTCCLK